MAITEGYSWLDTAKLYMDLIAIQSTSVCVGGWGDSTYRKVPYNFPLLHRMKLHNHTLESNDFLPYGLPGTVSDTFAGSRSKFGWLLMITHQKIP